jgi:hypothetical protein
MGFMELLLSMYGEMTLTLEGVGGQRHAPAAFTPGKEPEPIVQEAGRVPGPV